MEPLQDHKLPFPIVKGSYSGCVSGREFWFSIDNWLKGDDQKKYYFVAQFFVFVSTILLVSFLACAGCCISCDAEQKLTCGVYSVIGVVVCSINFCLEAWMMNSGGMGTKISDESSDFRQDKYRVVSRTYVSFYFQSWAAATFFYVVLIVLYALDTYLACCLGVPEISDTPRRYKHEHVGSNKSEKGANASDDPKSTTLTIEPDTVAPRPRISLGRKRVDSSDSKKSSHFPGASKSTKSKIETGTGV